MVPVDVVRNVISFVCSTLDVMRNLVEYCCEFLGLLDSSCEGDYAPHRVRVLFELFVFALEFRHGIPTGKHFPGFIQRQVPFSHYSLHSSGHWLIRQLRRLGLC